MLPEVAKGAQNFQGIITFDLGRQSLDEAFISKQLQ